MGGAGVFIAWCISISVSLTRYGQWITVTIGEGFIGAYWGGDSEWRNLQLYNGFSPPSSGSGAGSPKPDWMTWEFYGPTLQLRILRELASEKRYDVFCKRVLGLWRPRLGAECGSAYLVLPLWLPLLSLAIPTALLWYRDRRPPRGHCQECGYNLTGNVTGVCPEYGRATWSARESSSF